MAVGPLVQQQTLVVEPSIHPKVPSPDRPGGAADAAPVPNPVKELHDGTDGDEAQQLTHLELHAVPVPQ